MSDFSPEGFKVGWSYAVVLEVDVLEVPDVSLTGCGEAYAGPEAREESEAQRLLCWYCRQYPPRSRSAKGDPISNLAPVASCSNSRCAATDCLRYSAMLVSV